MISTKRKRLSVRGKDSLMNIKTNKPKIIIIEKKNKNAERYHSFFFFLLL